MDGKKAYTTTRIIAEGCKIEHAAALLLVKKYKDDINDVGLSDPETRNFKTKGRPRTEYLLNNPQAIFLIMAMKNTQRVLEIKKRISTGCTISDGLFNDLPETRNNNHVYVIGADNGLVKIGVSINPKARIRCIETQGGFKILSKAIKHFGEKAAFAEKMLHAKFSGNRVTGEWFECDFRAAVQAMEVEYVM